MVFIVVKQTEDDQFLYETTCSNDLEEVVQEVARLHNLRVHLVRLTEELEKLCSNIDDDSKSSTVNQVSLEPHVIQALQKPINEARILISKVSHLRTSYMSRFK